MQGEEPRLELLLSIDAHLREAVVPVALPAGGGSSGLFARLAHATLAGGLEMQKSEPPRSNLPRAQASVTGSAEEPRLLAPPSPLQAAEQQSPPRHTGSGYPCLGREPYVYGLVYYHWWCCYCLHLTGEEVDG